MARSVRITVIKATASDQAIGKIYEISNNNIVAGVDYTIPEVDYHDSGSILKCIDPHVGQSHVQQ